MHCKNIRKETLLSSYRQLLLLGLACLIGLFAVSLHLSRNMHVSLRTASENFVLTLRDQTAKSLSTHLEQFSNQLQILACQAALLPPEQQLAVFHEQIQSQPEIRCIVLTLDSGQELSAEGPPEEGTQTPYPLPPLPQSANRQGLTALLADGGRRVILSLPIQTSDKGPTAIRLELSAPAIQKLLPPAVLNGKGAFSLVDGYGGSLQTLQGKQNDILYWLRRMLPPTGFSQLQENIRLNIPGMLSIPFEKTSFFLTYAPISGSSWVLFSVIPQEELERQPASVVNGILLACGILLLVFTLLLAYSFSVERLRKKEAVEAREQLQRLNANLPGGILRCVAHPPFEVLYATSGFHDMTGFTPEEFRERFQNRLADLLVLEDREQTIEGLQYDLDTGHTIDRECRILRKNGTSLWLLLRGSASPKRPGAMDSIELFALDSTERHQMLDALARSEERYRLAYELNESILFDYSRDHDTLFFSSVGKKFFSLPETGYGLLNKTFLRALTLPEDRTQLFHFLRQILRTSTRTCDTEFRLRTKAGFLRWYSVRCSILRDDRGGIQRIVGRLADIDAKKREVASLEEKSRRDSLTGMLNKRATLTSIDYHLARLSTGVQHALLIIDIDHFKQINDTYGHIEGDHALCLVADALRETADYYKGFAARIGGDEFVLSVNGPRLNHPKEVAEHLNQALKQCCRRDHASFDLTLSVGWARCTGANETMDELFRRADEMQYEDKKAAHDRINRK